MLTLFTIQNRGTAVSLSDGELKVILGLSQGQFMVSKVLLQLGPVGLGGVVFDRGDFELVEQVVNEILLAVDLPLAFSLLFFVDRRLKRQLGIHVTPVVLTVMQLLRRCRLSLLQGGQLIFEGCLLHDTLRIFVAQCFVQLDLFRAFRHHWLNGPACGGSCGRRRRWRRFRAILGFEVTVENVDERLLGVNAFVVDRGTSLHPLQWLKSELV